MSFIWYTGLEEELFGDTPPPLLPSQQSTAGKPTDTTVELNPGSGGDSMDESNILVADFATGGAPASIGKRPRVVLGAEQDRTGIEPVRESSTLNGLPVVDAELRQMLRGMLDQRRRRLELLESLAVRALGR